jgi:hypothetical protein
MSMRKRTLIARHIKHIPPGVRQRPRHKGAVVEAALARDRIELPRLPR